MRAKRLGCVFSAKKLSPLEMSAGYGRVWGVAGSSHHAIAVIEDLNVKKMSRSADDVASMNILSRGSELLRD